MAVSQGRSVERSRLARLSSRLPPCWVGLRTTCLLAGASPWRGSKEARAPWRSLESGVPATVFARIDREEYSDGGSDDRGRSAQGLAHGGGDQRGGGAAG